MLRLLSFLFLVSAFFSCLPEKTALERALREAGDNRMELEKVLAYYRDDTLKYQAACFLIENMPDQYARIRGKLLLLTRDSEQCVKKYPLQSCKRVAFCFHGVEKFRNV